MIDISAPRIGPELAARRVAFTLNIGAGAVAIWQGIFPNVLTGAACIAAPWIAVSVAAFNQRFSSSAASATSTADIAGLWFPVLVLLVQAFFQQKMLEPLLPFLAALPFALFLFAALLKADLDARSASGIPFLIAACTAWAWASAIHINVALDTSAPSRMDGTVLEIYSSRGPRRMTVFYGHAGQKALVSGLPAGDRQVGSPVVIERKNGRFGWRYLRAL